MSKPTIQIIATTEQTHLLKNGDKLLIQDAESKAILLEENYSPEGITHCIHQITDIEVDTPDPNPQALSITAAIFDMEFQKIETRRSLLESLCAQCEIFHGRTPMPWAHTDQS